ncbi:hypothetical protein C4587_03030 [Candidatus Parcubacteria bacterium]|nr:MAG: hypothetical protein C4587_03030 [Candidatus Parcubacteria bacterium]
MIPKTVKLQSRKLPETPGVYLMKGGKGKILYVGKAGNLRRRVESYFARAHDSRIQKLVSEIRRIDCKKTDTALEALILEAELIRKYSPPFNVKEKDDKSFLYVEITREKFPRALLVRGKETAEGKRFGPFTSASSIREALRILRRIFPFSVHPPRSLGTFSRPCFEYEIGLCPGTCVGAIGEKDYRESVKNLTLFLEGKKEKIIRLLSKQMRAASERLEFEKAEKLKRQLFGLQHIRDVAFLSESEVAETGRGRAGFRIEGYDISDISGASAVGSMVVFRGDAPDKNEYRKFKIKTIQGPNDVGMLQEVLRRRFDNSWGLPGIVLVDGGAGQVRGAKKVLQERGLSIPVIGIAKGPERKRNDIIGIIPKGISKKTLIRVRDEAHRFAIRYHRALRGAIVGR